MQTEAIKGKIIVVNKYHAIYVERGINIMRGTIWENPYKVSKKGSPTREEVVQQYLSYLRKQYIKKGVIYRSLIDLAKRFKNGEIIVLVCCCRPKPCHGDMIKLAIEKIALTL